MKERREHHRYPARWRVAVICGCRRHPEVSIVHGMTEDISLGGANILTQSDYGAQQEVIVLLDIPPDDTGAATLRLQISAWTTYTLRESNSKLFRSGLRFDQMAILDHQLLGRHLATHFGAFPIPDRSARH